MFLTCLFALLFQLYGLGVPLNVLEITSDTAESFCFNLEQFVELESLSNKGGVQLADGGWLIPRNDGTAGKAEFYRYFGTEIQYINSVNIKSEYYFNLCFTQSIV